MTNDARLRRLESLLIAIYDALPGFIRCTLPNHVREMILTMRLEQEKYEKKI